MNSHRCYLRRSPVVPVAKPACDAHREPRSGAGWDNSPHLVLHPDRAVRTREG